MSIRLIPSNFYFHGTEKAITWVKNKIANIEEKFKENANHCLRLRELLRKLIFVTHF